MPENLPELAVDDDFSSEALFPDDNGIYKVVEYFRKDGTLYMRSTLSNEITKGVYALCTLTYFDRSGKIPLHQVVWKLGYDINKKIVSKRIE